MKINQDKVQFLRGILIAHASMGATITYEELRRLARLTLEQCGPYLEEARSVLRPGEPDFCAVAIKTAGQPGTGFGHLSLAQWEAELQKVFQYWKDRRANNNDPFVNIHGALPPIP